MKQPWFELLVVQDGRPPARRLFQGYSLDCAIEEAQKCYPRAEICIPERAAKVVLTKSRNGPKKTFREIQARRRQHESRS